MRDQRQILSTGYCWGLSPVMISGGRAPASRGNESVTYTLQVPI